MKKDLSFSLMMAGLIFMIVITVISVVQAIDECYVPSDWCYFAVEKTCKSICHTRPGHPTCDGVYFIWGECMSRICYQYWEFYCSDGYTGERECTDPGIICPMK